MNRRELIALLIAVGVLRARTAQAADPWFITPEEYERELKEGAVITPSGMTAAERYWSMQPKAGPGSPEILVRSPNTDTPIKGPVRIDVAFVAAPGAKIDLTTFKVSYGILGIDVTERVKKHATLNAEGVRADLPAMPKGKHNFELEIADTLQRTARKRVRCEVVA